MPCPVYCACAWLLLCVRNLLSHPALPNIGAELVLLRRIALFLVIWFGFFSEIDLTKERCGFEI